jgi:hypothetical protein
LLLFCCSCCCGWFLFVVVPLYCFGCDTFYRPKVFFESFRLLIPNYLLRYILLITGKSTWCISQGHQWTGHPILIITNVTAHRLLAIH